MMLARYIALNATGVGLVYAAWHMGWVDAVVAGDKSRLVFVIAAVFLAGLIAAGRRAWKTAQFVENRLVLLGLVGTVAGFALALQAIDISLVGDPTGVQTVATRLIEGLGTAIYTTLMGALGTLWLSLNRFLLRGPPYDR